MPRRVCSGSSLSKRSFASELPSRVATRSPRHEPSASCRLQRRRLGPPAEPRSPPEEARGRGPPAPRNPGPLNGFGRLRPPLETNPRRRKVPGDNRRIRQASLRRPETRDRPGGSGSARALKVTKARRRENKPGGFLVGRLLHGLRHGGEIRRGTRRPRDAEACGDAKAAGDAKACRRRQGGRRR